MTKAEQIKYDAKQFLIITAAALMTAVAVEFMLIPSRVILGGVAGIATLLDIVLGGNWYTSAGIWIALINIPIIIYCYVVYTRRYATKTLLYVLVLSTMLVVFRLTNAVNLLGMSEMLTSNAGNKVMVTLLGGALSGLALPLMISVNSSTGGTDIVGLIVQKRRKQSSGESMRVILIVNALIVLAASVTVFFVSGQDTIVAVNMFIYSAAAIFVGEIVQETIYKGFSAAIELEITTNKPEEMAEAFTKELKHGVTIIKAIGAYSHTERLVVVCVIQKRQLTGARRLIRNVDPAAFAYVANVKEVLGRGFANKEVDLEKEADEADAIHKVKK
jgi:uncharacterized membrane-anchored protein YitT (DUF2179 family)